jgi:hypothetical protein
MDTVDMLRANGQLVIDQLGPLSDVEFGLNRDSVVWIEGFIERQRLRADHDAGAMSGLVDVLGSFLGECLVAATGGRWRFVDSVEAWAVEVRDETFVFPFAKVEKLFRNGIEGGDSIVSFYDVAVTHLATGRLQAARQPSGDGKTHE